MEKISVIVPAYNAEEFLRRCVDSITSQTYKDLEIILVDDGSTDNTPSICDEYAEKEERVKVIHQENGGLSAARNAGMEAATTDYYVFVDADDEILPTMIDTLWYVMQETGADISQCGLQPIFGIEDREGVHESKVFNPKEVGDIEVYEGNEKLLKIYDLKPWSWVCVVQWNKLFKKSIFDEIRFPQGAYHEDEYVIHRELAAADKFAYVKTPLYMYYKHDGGITALKTAKRKHDVIEAMLDRVKFFQEEGYQELAVSAYESFLYHAKLKESDFTDYADIEEWKPAINALYAEGTSYWIKNLEMERLRQIRYSGAYKKDKIDMVYHLMLRGIHGRLKLIMYKASKGKINIA